MNKTIVIALLAATLAMPFVAHASTGACDSKGNVALGENEIGDGTADHTFYVDDRNYAQGNGAWLYQESNGDFTGGNAAADLQRGGASGVVPNDQEICVDSDTEAPDTLLV